MLIIGLIVFLGEQLERVDVDVNLVGVVELFIDEAVVVNVSELVN